MQGKELKVNFYRGLLQRDAHTGDYAVRNASALIASAESPDGAAFVLATAGGWGPGPTPPTPPSPPPAPPTPAPPAPKVKKCARCKGGECGCAWATPPSCRGSGDGSCCFKCCCSK